MNTITRALLRHTASAALLAATTLTPAPATAATVPAEQVIHTAYTTGYGWWDNTPRGSSIISNPVLHRVAGGTGTYTDPVTVAVGHTITNGRDILDYKPGTRMYVPNLRKYLIVEDTCGDGNRPQLTACHNVKGSAPGVTVWIDVWIGGSAKVTHATSDACESTMTDGDGALHELIINPRPGYTVQTGDILQAAGCKANYGNTPALVRR